MPTIFLLIWIIKQRFSPEQSNAQRICRVNTKLKIKIISKPQDLSLRFQSEIVSNLDPQWINQTPKPKGFTGSGWWLMADGWWLVALEQTLFWKYFYTNGSGLHPCLYLVVPVSLKRCQIYIYLFLTLDGSWSPSISHYQIPNIIEHTRAKGSNF